MINLLIVDDEPASIQALKILIDFDGLGLELIGEAEDGNAALGYIQPSQQPLIIITDMNMPNMDGIAFLEYMIDFHPEIPTIVVSGYFDFPYTHAAIKANVQDYLLKPIDREKLNAALLAGIEAVRRNEKRLPPTGVKPEHIDLPTYKELLKQCDLMHSVLDYGNEGNLDQRFESLSQLLSSSGNPDSTAKLAAKLFSDALTHYCVEHDLPVTHTEESISSGKSAAETVLVSLRQYYLDAYLQLQNQRKANNAEASLTLIHDYIMKNYRKALRLDTIAMKFHISKEYLSTLYHKKYGETVMDTVTRLKMEDAQAQLTHSDVPITLIAYCLGFEDAAYFNRKFKQFYGVSPGKYRRITNKL